MEKCSRRYLLISISLIVFGFSLVWFGSVQRTVPSLAPSPTPPVTITPVATSSATQGIVGERVMVTKVVDGDTIIVSDQTTVRFIGVDTPETVDPRRPVGCFGKEASNETKKLLAGKSVILQKDVSDKDKYNRILRYIYLPMENGQTLFINDYLVREGFGKVLTYPPDIKFDVRLREAERLAKINKKGLWGKCN